MSKESATEKSSYYDNLEKMSLKELLLNMNREDRKVPEAVALVIPQIEELVSQTAARFQKGGRLFYIGAGTSGRLGVLDASECPPTYGVPDNWVIGLIAGGDGALRKAVENAEDDEEQAWKDLQAYDINDKDTLVGIAASGRTPYVVGGLKTARSKGILTACITCNPDSKVSAAAEIPIEVIVGSEFVTGSTRMKSGTAQKLVLNMISTSLMIKLGRVRGNKMVDMQLSNEKLVKRGTRMIAEELKIDSERAKGLLLKYGSVRKAIDSARTRPKRYGLIGKNIEYSFSRNYFKAKFAGLGLEDLSYENFDLQDIQSIEQKVLPYLDEINGLNVTIPYKKEVMEYLDEVDAEAREIGAVNTIKIQNGRMIGYNTDAPGFADAIKPHLTEAHKKALILGTGGASKAIAHALSQLGIAFHFVSRQSIGEGVINYQNLTEEQIETHKLIIQCTPLGTFPDIEQKPSIPYDAIGSEHLLFDLVYNPEKTAFLEEGFKRGARIVNGEKMLENQAERSWAIWNA